MYIDRRHSIETNYHQFLLIIWYFLSHMVHHFTQYSLSYQDTFYVSYIYIFLIKFSLYMGKILPKILIDYTFIKHCTMN